MTMRDALQVAVGIVRNGKGEVLISQRAQSAHQGGLWEFPGGKVEAAETVFQALARELYEELNIKIYSATPLITIHHRYTDLNVRLEVYEVNLYEGVAVGQEHQEIQWVNLKSLDQYIFPDANLAIISALQLPKFYPIVDESLGDTRLMRHHLEFLITQGYRLIQLRAKSLSREHFVTFAKECILLCKEKEVELFVNTSLSTAHTLDAQGVHLTGKRLMALRDEANTLPIAIGASCHNEQQLKQAKTVRARFAVLSPVCMTKSHLNVSPLGWKKFNVLAEHSAVPVFALGGVSSAHLKQSIQANGQGISGIRGFEQENLKS